MAEERSKNRSHTTKGPGVMPHSRYSPHPAGTKRVKRFIRDAKGENEGYRKRYLELTGKTHP